jgi:hypothetical protein
MAYRIDVYQPGTGFLFSTDPDTMTTSEQAGAAYAALRGSMPAARISVAYVETKISDCTKSFEQSYQAVKAVCSK